MPRTAVVAFSTAMPWIRSNWPGPLPTDPNYYTNEILFDNTLIGDYMRINPGTA